MDNDSSYLSGHLLIAMPSMSDARFERSVIYMCAHSAAGAMGLVLNRLIDKITFPDLLEQLGIETPEIEMPIQIHFGGPVETSRGFVLHSGDYIQAGTMMVNEGIGLTASVDVLRSIAAGDGPRQHLLALGYAGWGPSQLDAEIQANGWLHASADDELIFGNNIDDKWVQAVNTLGIDVSMLSGEAGRA